MQVEDCIVNVERRSAGGCIDLAFAFTRQFAAPIYRLLLWFLIPSALIYWFTFSQFENQIGWASVIFLVFAPFFSAALVAGMGPQVFGVPFESRKALNSVLKRSFGYGVLMLVLRIFQVLTGFCFVLPSLFVSAAYGHIAEVMLLEQSKVNEVTGRLYWLCGGGGLGRYCLHLIYFGFYWFVSAVGVFLIFDFLSSTLFSQNILFGRIVGSPDIFQAIADLLIRDSSVTLVFFISAWLTYPIIRLAWFFSYLDNRIRSECWDIEVKFRQEAIRLRGAE